MHGIPIMSKSKKQTTNAKSTTGAELSALAECIPNVIWVQNMLSEIGFDHKPTIYVDNAPMVDIITNGKLSPGTKHREPYTIPAQFVRALATWDMRLINWAWFMDVEVQEEYDQRASSASVQHHILEEADA